MEYYRRNLPHWQPKGAEYFITFRLAGTLPKEAVLTLKEKQKQFKLMGIPKEVNSIQKSRFEAKIFQVYDHLLDSESTGPTWLANKNVARIVTESIHFYDQDCYDLYAYTIMSNHVHLVFRHLDENHNVDFPVTHIMKKIKSYTAKEANKILGRKGKFWQVESYDRVIRDEKELENKIRYTLSNPVKAGLISDWRKWPHTFCKPELAEAM